jgi:S1-C subfamily serine protease
LTNRPHRAYIATIFEGHGEGSAKAFENFYEAQCLWDEGMAQSLSEFLESSGAEGKTVLVFAGSGHIVFGFGIPNRLYRRTPVSYQTVLLKAWSKKMNGDLSFARASSPPAHFLWITKPNPPEKRKPRIGVVLKQLPLTPPSPHRGEGKGEGGLVIDQVLPGSPAEKAGLLPGDQLIAVEGIEIREVKEIHDALSEKGWGNDITFTITREGKQKEIAVKLPPAGD